jgi:uncharacterized membrane protein YjjP (DUF1212 family)
MKESRKVLDLAVKAGEILLQNGAEIFRVQETMTRIAAAYSYGSESFHAYVLSNAIFASLREEDGAYNADLRNIPLSPVHLGRVDAVNSLSRAIAEGRYSPDEALAQIERIRSLPENSPLLLTFSSGIVSATFCYLFGGGLLDSLAAFFTGLILYFFLIPAKRWKLSKIVSNILGSVVITLCALCFTGLGFGGQADKIIIGAIMPMAPGVPLTTSIRDFFNGDYLSGAIRMLDAILIAACIAIGVGFVLKTGNLLLGVQL